MDLDRTHIEKIAQTPDQRVLLAKVWDRMQSGIRRNIPAASSFLTLPEQEMTRYLFGNAPGIQTFGGYAQAQRRMLVYLPEYLDESWLMGPEGPVVCLRATFYAPDALTHRDFLGALMGMGIAREAVGDICVGQGSCDFFVTAEIAPYLISQFLSVGRSKIQITPVSLDQVQVPEPEIRLIRDTLASLRLDSVISAGFRISRSQAAQAVAAGRVAIDGLPCEKPDKLLEEGVAVSLRGMGKIQLHSVNGQTKKGRISVEIHRFV